ncbi:protein-tyrosine phosphatase family protein [Nannocystis radixulma]|uniref:Tyrosine-protein phosphatase n=1 Tax=Nannocystis radixulma TaxID=2995305 RepID=A0ABT5BPH1_9BACT|nr:tyrosine-protein phosphatase [Nannocystis radixulma]MDC0676061.1 tyrosine-protein phosphatase [Nannocystis radixulma]
MSSYRLTWCPLRGGHLAIGHKPGRDLRAALAASGCTHVLSLLAEHERGVEAAGVQLRLPLASADPPGAHRTAEVVACFEQLRALLDAAARIYLHCSAGLHRTGMVTHAFLRFLGHSRDEALARMAELREATAEAATEPRLQWGEQFARPREEA